MAVLGAVSAVGLLVACNDSPTEVEFEVIEQVTFAPALDVDLAAMTKLPEGVYIQDRVAGTGPGLAEGGHAWLYYELYLRNGTPIQNNAIHFPFPLGGIEGWDIGLEGMAAGATRLIIIPPELAYGGVANGPIPAGSILVFEIELDSIT
jgi:FKBP-type peptidyl-prolyl cis-trans isomerase FkpA